jgi:hypothetical protein
MPMSTYEGPIAIVGMGVPALTTWRRGDRGESVTADWRYRVTWMPAPDSRSGGLSGTWLLVAPRRGQFRDLAAQCARAMAGRGAQVDTMLVDCAAISWDVLAGLLEAALAGESLAGVVSFLALSETPQPDRRAASAGLTGTLELVRALGDTGIAVPLWMLTREAVPGDLEHPDPEPAERRGGLTGRPAEFGAQAAALLCSVLTGWDADQGMTRPSGTPHARRRRAAWSAEADRECFQPVNEAAGTPA